MQMVTQQLVQQTNGYDVTGQTAASGSGPTDGGIKAEDDDGLSISYEFNDGEVVVGSALVRWNVGEAQWLESSLSCRQ